MASERESGLARNELLLQYIQELGYDVDFLEPLNPRPPALAQERAFPSASVSVTIVLLKEDWICACPCSTFFLTRRFVVVFLVVFAILKLTYAFLNQSKFIVRILNYFFLFATVLFGPLRVLALVFVF